MKIYGIKFLWFCLFVFFIAGSAFGKTYYVTQGGGGGTISAAQFNALTGDYSGDTFYFSGDFTTRITMKIHGSSSGHVTFDGRQGGTCNPTATVDLSLCSGAANLTRGMDVGTSGFLARYVIVQDFNMDATPSSHDYVVRVVTLGDKSTGGRVVFRRNTIINAPQMFFHWYGNDGPYNVIEDNKFLGMGRKGQVHASTSFFQLTNSVIRRNIIGHDFIDVGPKIDSWSRWGQINFHGNHDVLVEQNRVFGAYSGDLIRPKEGGLQDNIIIRHNHLYNGKLHGIFPYGYHQERIYIYGNRVSHVDGVGIFVSSDADNTHIWGNIVKDAYSAGIGVYSFLYENPENTHISNNTIVYNGFGNWTDKSAIRLTRTAGVMRIMNNIVAYNDISRTHPKQIWHGSYTGLQSTHNLVYGGPGKNTLWSLSSNSVGDATHTLAQAQSAGYEQSPLVADPRFAHLGVVPTESQAEYYRDLRLTADSPAINSGRDLSGYGSFSVNIGSGDTWFQNYTGYGTITFSYNDGLHPRTDWTTPIPTIVPAKFSDYGSGWERGAYVFDEGNSQKTIIKELNETTILNPPANFKMFN